MRRNVCLRAPLLQQKLWPSVLVIVTALVLPAALSAQSKINLDTFALEERLEGLKTDTDLYWMKTRPVTSGDRINLKVGYHAKDVDKFYTRYRGTLEKALSQPELGPLRDYALRNVPLLPEERFQTGFGMMVNTESTERFIGNSRDLLTQLIQKVNDLSVGFSVESLPNGATFRLLRIAGATVRETTTNSRLDGIYRGLYTYAVEKVGYKRVVGSLDLVNTSPVRVMCRMAASAAVDDPAPCMIQ